MALNVISPGHLTTAFHYAAMGYRCIPLLPGTKAPAVKWKLYQERKPTEAELRQWFEDKENNIAILTGEAIVVDCDCPDIMDSVIARYGITPSICRTPRGGFHLYYRKPPGVAVGNSVRIRGEPVDLRAENGLAAVPFSTNHEGTPYEWISPLVPADELPAFRLSCLEPRREVRVEPITVTGDRAKRARSYLASIEGAVSGQGGHNHTMRVAGILMQKFGLSIQEALPLFLEWNAKCEPPWTEKELLHKLEDAWKNRTR